MTFQFTSSTGLFFLVLVLMSFILSFSLTFPFKNLAVRMNFMDIPSSNHKTHLVPIPYMGGLPIALTVGLMSVVIPSLVTASNLNFGPAILMVSLGIIISVVGLIDDKLNLSVNLRLSAQVIISLVASSLVITQGYVINATSNKFLNLLISCFWIVCITNFFNFIDNIDGGSTGITVITCFFIFVLSLLSNQIAVASLALCQLGANLGFLNWNFPDAKMFLGDCGSLFNGYLVAIMYLLYDSNRTSVPLVLLATLFIFVIPVSDATIAIVSRLFRGRPITLGGRDHLSHRLLEIGFTKKHTVVVLWAFSFIFALGGTLIQVGPSFLLYPIIVLGSISLLAGVIYILSKPHMKS